MLNFTLNNRFINELPADKTIENTRRKVFEACYSFVTPRQPSNPQMVHVSTEMLTELGLHQQDAVTSEFLDIVSGKQVYSHTKPYAMCYGGHQFGQWAGQLGDGRAINLFSVDTNDQTLTLQLKGAGVTPYSRSADGLAVLRSSIREHLCSEAMHHLGVPTTRSLSLALTGDQVMRDILYNGNPAYEKGAVVCRVARSFLRFGSFEIFASRKDKNTLQQLVDYTVKHHFPQIKSTGKQAVIDLFREVSERTLATIVHWQRVGFVHGVMNTDNLSILGLTIDYGPYGWLEDYNPNWTPNTTDAQGRRYRFANQPSVAQWNLMQLANSLYFLTGEGAALKEILNNFATLFNEAYYTMMFDKLGLQQPQKDGVEFVKQTEQLLYKAELDYIIFFRELSIGNLEASSLTEKASYSNTAENQEKIGQWLTDYQTRLTQELRPGNERQKAMQAINPKYVLRNYMAQLAIEQAEKGDYSLIDELYELLKQPYTDQTEYQKWYAKRPNWAKNKIGSSMLSCSS